MKALAYRLRHRIDLQALTSAQDSEGATEEGWVSVLGDAAGKLPAEVMALSGREFVAAQAVQAGVTTAITIRAMPGVEPSMRVVHDGIAYNIRAVLPDPKRVRHLTLMAESGVNEG